MLGKNDLLTGFFEKDVDQEEREEDTHSISFNRIGYIMVELSAGGNCAELGGLYALQYVHGAWAALCRQALYLS